MNRLPKPRAVIFDWDDTVIDSWHVALQAFNTAMQAMGHKPWTDEEARKGTGTSARDMFMSLFGSRWEEANKVYYDTYTRIMEDNIRTHHAIEDLLSILKDNAVYTAVVSNKRGPLLRDEAKRLNFEHYFGRIIGAGDAKADKPDPAPVMMALDGSGILPGQDVWFVGDSHIDMRCAHNTGCTAILIETKVPDESVLQPNPPARRFKSHSNIMSYINDYFI